MLYVCGGQDSRWRTERMVGGARAARARATFISAQRARLATGSWLMRSYTVLARSLPGISPDSVFC